MLDVKSVRSENSIGFITEGYDLEFDEALESNLFAVSFNDGKLYANTSTFFGPDEVELTKSQTFELFLIMRDYFKDEVWASDFRKYRRTNIAEMREVTNKDIACFQMYGVLYIDFNEHINYFKATDQKAVSISDFDLENGSPKIGDMIARNPDNHKDSWLVAKEYFEDNFEIIHNAEEVEEVEERFIMFGDDKLYKSEVQEFTFQQLVYLTPYCLNIENVRLLRDLAENKTYDQFVTWIDNYHQDVFKK